MLLTINDDVLVENLLKNGDLLHHFPFMVAAKNAADAVTTCRTCPSKKAAQQANLRATLNNTKRILGTMDEASLNKFKTLVKADKVRVQWVEQVGTKIDRKVKTF